MHSEPLNEHDANQGAQSKGEFLGMTGNSAWYLLGAAGTSVLSIIVLWGVLGFPLLVCLGFGAVLCALSVAYVFALKNNKPEHYDTDFFESALVDAGIQRLAFGPRTDRVPNPFRGSAASPSGAAEAFPRRPAGLRCPAAGGERPPATTRGAKQTVVAQRAAAQVKESESPHEPVVALAAYEALRDELDNAQEVLEDALAAREEDVP